MGIVATLLRMPLAGWLYLRLGYANLRADAGPSEFESTLAVTALRRGTQLNRKIRFSRLKRTWWMVRGFTGTNAPIVTAGPITRTAIVAVPSIRVLPSS